jgi:hypothetical protein
MLEGFICPDGEKVKYEDCISHCRMGDIRCLTLPTLVSIGQIREWKGVASTTQLLNGTMYEFLKIIKPFYVDPDDRAFMLQGTKHHKELELVAKELGLASEIPLSIDRDIFDLLEYEGKELVLTDYKLWGSFKVAKALGLVETGKQPDPSRETYKTSGKWGKAGSAKMVAVFTPDPSKADMWEAELQLNRYRVMVKKLGLNITKMRIQATVRDGGLYSAKGKGVLKKIYMLPVKLLPDEYVEDYFLAKDICLRDALFHNKWDIPCNVLESWDGARCEGYCEIWEHCPKGTLVHQIGGK